jgi:hypothetical protein
MMRFDFGQLDSVEVPVVLDGTDGKLLWLEGELPDRSRAFVFARPPGIIGGNPQRTCAKIWVAIYYPGSTTPRPKTYSFVSKTPVLGESVNECPPTPVPDLDIVVRGGDEVRIFQDDEAEGYHED